MKTREKDKNNFLAIINIDGFKDINDFYGHQLGDELLVQVAKKISGSCNQNRVRIYKLPSDEYAIFSTEETTLDEFVFRIRNLIEKLQATSYRVGENRIYIRVSCGIVCDKEDILIKADTALKIAKSNKKSLVVYEKGLNRNSVILNNIKGISFT